MQVLAHHFLQVLLQPLLERCDRRLLQEGALAAADHCFGLLLLVSVCIDGILRPEVGFEDAHLTAEHDEGLGVVPVVFADEHGAFGVRLEASSVEEVDHDF